MKGERGVPGERGVTTLHNTHRYARYAVECFTNPAEFKTPVEYRIAMIEAMTDLARALGVEPPDDIADYFGVAA
jgi:hypothetical protein